MVSISMDLPSEKFINVLLNAIQENLSIQVSIVRGNLFGMHHLFQKEKHKILNVILKLHRVMHFLESV